MKTWIKWAGLGCVVAALASLSGCANDPFAPLADALLGKDRHQQQTGQSPATGNSQVATASQEDVCKKLNLVSTASVDTVYARARKTLNFRTWEQARLDARVLGGIDPGFKHDATPGAYYRMADYREYQVDGRPFSTGVEMEIAREGSKTAISAQYCVDRRAPWVNDSRVYAHMDKLIREVGR
jgi:hypothetical protein